MASSPRDILAGTDATAEVDVNITFQNPLHPSYSLTEQLEETDFGDHYNHIGNYSGEVRLDGTQKRVDATGFRDHSWGGHRSWTPNDGGHRFAGIQFENGHSFYIVGLVSADGSLYEGLGYHDDGEELHEIESIEIEYDDGLEMTERALEWAHGNLPTEMTFALGFGDRTERITTTPTHSVPLGYEDRNWSLSSVDADRATSILNRVALDCEWESQSGSGWFEAPHPLNR